MANTRELSDRRMSLSVAAAGAGAWLATGPLALWVSDVEPSSWLALSVSLLPLAALAVGLHSLPRRLWVSEVCLVGLFPPATLMSAYALVPAGSADALGAVSVAGGGASLIIYLIGALRALANATELSPSASAPLEGSGEDPDEHRRRRAGTLWVVASAAGAFGVATVAPYLHESGELRLGEDTSALRLLTASIGVGLGLGALAFLVAPSLRARRGPTGVPWRWLGYLVALAAAGAILVLTRR